MRVRIQYSVDLDEVPSKISGFLKDSVNLLEEVQGDLVDEAGNLAKEKVSQHSLDAIDAIRQDLAKIDGILADSHSIIAGYIQAKTPPPPEMLEMREPEAPDVLPEG